ncbi:MAG: hypothetical protein KatS3mg115_0778 [Candidatus Poribacteria bacterium]|nr:MAG: hypothetical protein KatS3mg115_0778 [Candidatus Poribacteria bacterium]
MPLWIRSSELSRWTDRIGTKTAIWTTVLALGALPLWAQEKPRDPVLLLVPVLGYSPETSWMLGLSGMYQSSWTAQRPPQSVYVVSFYTLRKQFLSSIYWDAPLPTRQLYVQVGAGFERFPDRFYGLGRTTQAEDYEKYTPERFYFQGWVGRSLGKGFRAGPLWELSAHRLIETDPAGKLASGAVLGTERGTLVGIGLFLERDTRDHPTSPISGGWYRAEWLPFPALLGSDYAHARWRVRLRRYLQVGQRGTVALQAEVEAATGKVPFHALPKLGGSERLRGYWAGRFRDRRLYLVQAELRRYRLWGPLGGTFFVGVGDVAPDWNRLSLRKARWSFGVGVRALLDAEASSHLRLDYAIGSDERGFYVNFGEAF